MEQILHSAFPIPIAKSKLNRKFSREEAKEIEKIAKNCRDNQHNIVSSSSFIFRDFLGLKDLESFIYKHIKKYADTTLSIRGDNQSLEITQSWLNITNSGQQHHRHEHPNSIVSGVFYINTIKDDSIIFYNPNHKIYKHLSLSHEKGEPDSYNNGLKMGITAGELILFPSWLEHSVDINNTNESRISIAFNTKLKGQFGHEKFLTYVEY